MLWVQCCLRHLFGLNRTSLHRWPARYPRPYPWPTLGQPQSWSGRSWRGLSSLPKFLFPRHLSPSARARRPLCRHSCLYSSPLSPPASNLAPPQQCLGLNSLPDLMAPPHGTFGRWALLLGAGSAPSSLLNPLFPRSVLRAPPRSLAPWPRLYTPSRPSDMTVASVVRKSSPGTSSLSQSTQHRGGSRSLSTRASLGFTFSKPVFIQGAGFH